MREYENHPNDPRNEIDKENNCSYCGEPCEKIFCSKECYLAEINDWDYPLTEIRAKNFLNKKCYISTMETNIKIFDFLDLSEILDNNDYIFIINQTAHWNKAIMN